MGKQVSYGVARALTRMGFDHTPLFMDSVNKITLETKHISHLNYHGFYEMDFMI
jgi:hypothetical protein